mmetsp:Transcript_17513/g.52678  ORF Transcript_17513/g.52678 Transcript_17513/m.52678 type:complete len:266 (+) Transcript_17513:1407-2204(+)
MGSHRHQPGRGDGARRAQGAPRQVPGHGALGPGGQGALSPHGRDARRGCHEDAVRGVPERPARGCLQRQGDAGAAAGHVRHDLFGLVVRRSRSCSWTGGARAHRGPRQLQLRGLVGRGPGADRGPRPLLAQGAQQEDPRLRRAVPRAHEAPDGRVVAGHAAALHLPGGARGRRARAGPAGQSGNPHAAVAGAGHPERPHGARPARLDLQPGALRQRPRRLLAGELERPGHPRALHLARGYELGRPRHLHLRLQRDILLHRHGCRR